MRTFLLRAQAGSARKRMPPSAGDGYMRALDVPGYRRMIVRRFRQEVVNDSVLSMDFPFFMGIMIDRGVGCQHDAFAGSPDCGTGSNLLAQSLGETFPTFVVYSVQFVPFFQVKT